MLAQLGLHSIFMDLARKILQFLIHAYIVESNESMLKSMEIAPASDIPETAPALTSLESRALSAHILI